MYQSRAAVLVFALPLMMACQGADDTHPGTTTTTGSGGSGGTTTSTNGSGGATGTTSSSSSTTSSTTSSSTTTTSSSTGGGGTGGVPSCGPSPAPQIVQQGTGGLLLRGTVVTPDQVFTGEVYITGDTLACVAASCPEGAGATIVDTAGVIFPGLIDTHNHILFDVFDETHWTPTASYTNHNQWTNEARYSALVDTKQFLNGEGTSTVDLGCEMNKYGELKGLVAGTTSILGAANPANRACYGSLARTIDQTPNGLGADHIQVATLFPTTTAADGVCANASSGQTTAYVIHVAEGTDQTALNEFTKLGTVTTQDGCLYAPQTTIVHGVALGATELDLMAQHQMSLVWSPRSNVFLYGGGTDLTTTADIPGVLGRGINVALAPDWSIGGSQNLLDELRFAHRVDAAVFGGKLTPQMLVQMVTVNAAKALGLSATLGSLTPGKKADVMVIGAGTCDPYDALLAATPADVRLVLVGGAPLYGDPTLRSLAPASPGCEDLDVCGSPKFACVAASGGTATNKLGQTYAELQSAISQGLADYDALALSAWKFSPITPLVRCP